MKTKILAVAGVALAALCLSACSTTNTENATAFIRALGDAYEHCDRQVTYNLAIGPMNPGSGANVAGTVHCPPKLEPPPATMAAPASAPVT